MIRSANFILDGIFEKWWIFPNKRYLVIFIYLGDHPYLTSTKLLGGSKKWSVWKMFSTVESQFKKLGVTKIFLKSRFFLISNTRKPLKKHNFAKWTSETIQIYYCFNIVKCFWIYLWMFSSFLIKIRKIWKFYFLFFFWNCS